jgi:hypothetical protein
VTRVLSVVLVAAAACGEVDTGSDAHATPNGTGLIVTGSLPLGASSFAAVSGATTCMRGGASTGIAYAAIVASDLSGICGALQQDRSVANARSIELVVVRVGSADPTAALTTGAYPVAATPGSQLAYALLRVSQNDAHCSPSYVIATQGNVQVTSVAGGELRGTIVAQLSDGGGISGAFAASACTGTSLGDVCAGKVGPSSATCAP